MALLDDFFTSDSTDTDRTIEGTSGDDNLVGGTKGSTIVGEEGDDTLTGGSGSNNLSGGDGDDVLRGGSGSNILIGGDGNDSLLGGSGSNDLEGEAGNDTLVGGTGGNDLDGGEDDDYLVGGTGSNNLTGGSGADTFFFSRAESSSTIIINGQEINIDGEEIGQEESNDNPINTIADFDASEGDRIQLDGDSLVSSGETGTLTFDDDTEVLFLDGEPVVRVIDGEDSEVLDNTEIVEDGDSTASETSEDLVDEAEFLQNPSLYMEQIRDFDGNDLGAVDFWQQIGSADVQGDGDIEYVFVNPELGRWATVGADDNDTIDFSDYGEGGDTRIVGIYEDPLVRQGIVDSGSPFDSQQRFQNDLLADNLTLIEDSDRDYDGDGLQEIYFEVNDGTTVLHAYMHADSNIQYANYQSEADLEEFMDSNDIDDSVWEDWF